MTGGSLESRVSVGFDVEGGARFTGKLGRNVEKVDLFVELRGRHDGRWAMGS